MTATDEQLDAAGADDAHLPRLQRRFPYKALTPTEAAEVRVETDAILRGIHAMIHGLILRRMTPRELRNHDLRHEIYQNVVIHLWSYSLPKYDASRETKVTTFLHKCAAWRVTDRLHVYRRQRRKNREVSMVADDAIMAPDTAYDRAVEAAAESITRNPEAFGLTGLEGRAIRAAATAEPDVSRQALAESVGLKCASSFCTALKRGRDRISQIDLF